MAGGTWLGLSRSGKLAVITNSPSEWDHYLASIAGRMKSVVLRSSAMMAAALAAAVASRRKESGRVASLGLLFAGVVAGSVGLAVAVTMAIIAAVLVSRSGIGIGNGRGWRYRVGAGDNAYNYVQTASIIGALLVCTH